LFALITHGGISNQTPVVSLSDAR